MLTNTDENAAFYVEDHFQSRNTSFWDEEAKKGDSYRMENHETYNATAGGYEDSKSIDRQDERQSYKIANKADYRINQTFHGSSRHSSENKNSSILSQVKEEAKDRRDNRQKSMRLQDSFRFAK